MNKNHQSFTDHSNQFKVNDLNNLSQINAEKKILSFDNFNQKYFGAFKTFNKHQEIQNLKSSNPNSFGSDVINSQFVFEEYDIDGKLISKEDITD